MLWAKLSTAATITVGPILDSTGAEYTGAVIGDLTLRKHDGSSAAMASAATLTHVDNGHYTLVTTTGNMDTIGRLQIRCNKSTYQMPPVEIMVLPAAVYDTLITNGTLASTTSGRTIAVDSSGIGDANIAKLLGTAIATPATAGVIDANVKNMNNVAATSITTINANQGTTQPTNFTGTAGSALVKSDMVDVAGAAVSTSSAQIGVNAVNVGGTAQTGGDIYAYLTTNLGLLGASLSAIPKTGFKLASDGLAAVTAWTVAITGNITGNLSGSVGSVASGGIASTSFAANAINAAAIADGAIDRATFAADTGLQSIRSNTAQAGGSTSITLDASASAVTNFYLNCLIVTTGGTGAGQARFCTAYNGSTKVATVAAWATNPDSSTTFAIMAFDSVPGATAPTAAAVATAVWQDLLAGSDFSTASSIGKLLKDDINVALNTLATPTNITAGTITTVTNLTNAPTAGDFTSTMKTSLNNATPSVTVSDKTGFSLSAAGILAIWNQLTADAGILANTFAAKLKNWVLGSDSKALLSSDAQTGAVIPRVTLTDTVTTYTGNTPQTGDNYARLGAPAGASIAADIAAVEAFSDRVVGRGTVGSASTTTSIVTSAMTPAGVHADQFKGRIVIFDRTTTTTALRGQATDITASSAASLPVLTVTALTDAPQAGDTFSVV